MKRILLIGQNEQTNHNVALLFNMLSTLFSKYLITDKSELNMAINTGLFTEWLSVLFDNQDLIYQEQLVVWFYKPEFDMDYIVDKKIFQCLHQVLFADDFEKRIRVIVMKVGKKVYSDEVLNIITQVLYGEKLPTAFINEKTIELDFHDWPVMELIRSDDESKVKI